MRYRVEQLATACEVSVDTVRYYQARGLLPQPDKEGRVAWYRAEHADRIRQIRALQRQGLTLAAIRRVVDGELGPADAGLAAAVAAERGEADDGELMSLDAFASASGVPASLIQAVEREGIRIGNDVDGETRYTPGDIEVVRTALRLLEFGLPLGDLLSLARDADEEGPAEAGQHECERDRPAPGGCLARAVRRSHIEPPRPPAGAAIHAGHRTDACRADRWPSRRDDPLSEHS